MESFPFPSASRREWLHLAGGLALSGLGLPSRARAQSPSATAAANLVPYQRFPRMVHEYYVAKVRGIEKRLRERICQRRQGRLNLLMVADNQT